MLSIPDVYRAAGLLLDQRGERAATFATHQTQRLLDDGDFAGSRDWRRILAGIEDLRLGERERETASSRSRLVR
jgi:hypothetical protein